MKLRLALSSLAAVLLLLHAPQWVSASSSREHDPLQVTGSAGLFSRSTGQTVMIASLILPHADTLEGTTVTLTINNATTVFTLDKRGNAKIGTTKASLRLGKPTCSCKDSSHLARLSVSVRGTKAKKSVFATADGAAPAQATVQFAYLAEALNFEAPLTVRK